jgi:hypothetical protein
MSFSEPREWRQLCSELAPYGPARLGGRDVRLFHTRSVRQSEEERESSGLLQRDLGRSISTEIRTEHISNVTATLACSVSLYHTSMHIACCNCVLAAEPPKGNQHCPRKNGYFAHPDPSVCHLFYNCIDGEFTEVPCTPGLHFDEYQGTCVWPESSGRSGCSKTESE